jgi:hypothetical protein
MYARYTPHDILIILTIGFQTDHRLYLLECNFSNFFL